MKQLLETRDAISLAYAFYNQAKPHLRRLRDRDIRHPEWTHRLLSLFGRPDSRVPAVAITGSKGKGSHAILLAGMLQQLDYRVGLFTGPHLVDFMERFRVNGKIIPEPEFVDLMMKVYDQARAFSLSEGEYIGPVGLLAVAAALWFEKLDTTVNVIECGRGALHDDVNRWMHQTALLTPVFLEHTFELGPTIEDIAYEKSGVITEETKAVFSHRQSPTVADVLDRAAGERGVQVEMLGREFRAVISRVGAGMLGEVEVHVVSPTADFRVLLPGRLASLADNAAVAGMAARSRWLHSHDAASFPATLDLRAIHLPGRLHEVRQDLLTIVDGTIHAESAVRVRAYAEDCVESKRVDGFGLVMGVPDDKDGEGVLAVLSQVASFVVISKAANPHLHFEHNFESIARRWFREVYVSEGIVDAVAIADTKLKSEAGMKQPGLLIVGTQSFVGDALRHFGAQTTSIWTGEQKA